MLFALTNQDIQDRLYQEIVKVIPENEDVNLSHRKLLDILIAIIYVLDYF